ncbi:MAG TPA: PHP domain-containing protein [Thermoflexia bacterium]|nr:PHP domain-containing protein [Thermoflexia bacterium]
MRVDLHIHTTASDGRWTPEQVIAGVQAEGIGLFAISDHDSIANVAETERLARAAALRFLRAVEISTTVGGNIFHILAYNIDLKAPALRSLLAENTAKMEATDDHDIRALIELGYPLDFEEYQHYTYERTRGGFKSLNYLLDKGLCASPQEFFEQLSPKFGRIWPDFLHPTETVAVIRAAGGVPILAHPGASFRNLGGVTEATLNSLLPYGIAGVECYSQYHDEETTQRCVAWCERHDWLITGGSDYHGGYVNRQLGVPVVDTSALSLGELFAASCLGD